jgi:hypothetical protein
MVGGLEIKIKNKNRWQPKRLHNGFLLTNKHILF